MRVIKENGDFRVKAIAGTHTVLIALDCKDKARKDLAGFAMKREVSGAATPAKWLKATKVFKSLVPVPDPHKVYSSLDHPRGCPSSC